MIVMAVAVTPPHGRAMRAIRLDPNAEVEAEARRHANGRLTDGHAVRQIGAGHPAVGARLLYSAPAAVAVDDGDLLAAA